MRIEDRSGRLILLGGAVVTKPPLLVDRYCFGPVEPDGCMPVLVPQSRVKHWLYSLRRHASPEDGS
jgi:hypothetical protein